MRIYVVRHAEAFDVGEKGIGKDDDRFLTGRGEKSAARAGALLKRLRARPDCVWTSPLARARQTAELLCRKLRPSPPIIEMSALAPPGRLADLTQAIQDQDVNEAVLVGHEPFLGELLGYLLSGEAERRIPLEKTAIACVEADPGDLKSARLQWLIDPAVMKTLLSK